MLGNDGALSIEDVNQLLDWKVAVSHALTSSSSIVQPPTTHVVSALLCGPGFIPIVTHVVTADEVQIINESDETDSLPDFQYLEEIHNEFHLTAD